MARMPGGFEFQRAVAQNMMRAIMSRNYSQLAMFLEILARSIDDVQMVDRIQSIKKNTSIEFESLCILYLRSFVMPPYRGIRFIGTGQKILWPKVREMAVEEIVNPLNAVSVELMGRLSLNTSVLLKDYIERISDVGEVPSEPPEIRLEG